MYALPIRHERLSRPSQDKVSLEVSPIFCVIPPNRSDTDERRYRCDSERTELVSHHSDKALVIMEVLSAAAASAAEVPGAIPGAAAIQSGLGGLFVVQSQVRSQKSSSLSHNLSLRCDARRDVPGAEPDPCGARGKRA